MGPLAHPLRMTAVLAWLLLASAAPLEAVVINSAYEVPNLIAPGDDPGWNNVARVSSASAVYLGNRWVITANHVSRGPVHFSDGRVFDVSVGSDVRILGVGTGALFGADLRMFRLAQDPGLPALTIADAPPTRGTMVTMIGASVDRAPELIGWSNSLGIWTPIRTPLANEFGYSLLQTSHMRWGMNQVSSTGSSLAPSINTFLFSTGFDRPGIPFEAQGATGDSGGGVFQKIDGHWQLVGLMNTISTLPGQPDQTVVYGDSTNASDLSRYRDQILALVNHAEPLWQNQINHFDVDGSGRVNARDVLRLVNELQKRASSAELIGAPGASDPMVDVNGDGRVNASDAQQLISALLNGSARSTAGLQASAHFIPEPASLVLALAGVSIYLMGRLLGRRRRP